MFSPVKKILLLVLFALIVNRAVAQQTFSYTQYMDNLTPVNPAFALLSDDGSIHTIVRKQWLGIPGAPTSYLMNANFQIKQLGAAAGFIVRDDQFAVEQQTEFDGFFAKSIPLNDNQKLAVSLNGGMRYYTTNYASLDPLDPVAHNDIKQLKPNAGIGVMFYSDKYYVGLSVPELNIRSLSDTALTENNNLRNHYYLAGGFVSYLDGDEDFKIKPSALISCVRGVPLVADISTMFYAKDVFGVGLSYRTDNETAVLFSVDLDLFHFGYSYQFATSAANIGSISNATHEVSVAIHFGRGNQVPINFGN